MLQNQPTAVIIDTDTLNTLDERNYRSGFAEAVKLALATDSELFATLEAGVDRFLAREPEFLATIIGRCCELKASIVAEDEHETGRRTLLNLGHTFGHALEKMGDYKKWLHGEAVSLGIAIAMKLSHEVNDLENSAVDRSISLLKQANLPVELPGDFNYGALVNAMRGDKKSQAGKIRLVLLAALGEAQLGNPMEFEDLLLLLNKLGIN